MAFCEECGAKITPECRFCEECGTPVENVSLASAKAVDTIPSQLEEIFCDNNWAQKWVAEAMTAKCFELGIILTSEQKLLNQLNASHVELKKVIYDYTVSATRRGVKYYYLNIDKFPSLRGNSSVTNIVKLLKEIADAYKPKYLFILGNEDVIDVIRWKNECGGDFDKIVESDFCFSTLDTNSPWDGQQYDFNNVIRVGRLPTYLGEDFEKFKSYFDTASNYIGKIDKIVPYGLGALKWDRESNYEYKKFSSSCVDSSPTIVCSNVSSRIGNESNLFMFNLHGSDKTKYWYGEDWDDGFPEAIEPKIFEDFSRPYFIGVEACYGARYLNGLNPRDSILLTVMENKCISFLGSSRIAYGSIEPTGCCADFVIGSYLAHLKKGVSAGDAHIAGLMRLTEDWHTMEDTEIKTMVEFSLYGDPSACMCSNAHMNESKGLFSQTTTTSSLLVPMPDVARAVRSSIVNIDSKIESMVDNYVMQKVLPEINKAIEIANLQMTVFKMSKSGLYQKVYSYNLNSFDRIVRVYFDDSGEIKKALVSK